MKTNERRNRKLCELLSVALRNVAVRVDDERGYGDSLYVNVEFGEWEGTLRVSDHDQPAGGGWSESRGERHGEADISVRIFNAKGENLVLEDNGDILRLPLAIASFDSDVPEPVRLAVGPVVAHYAATLEARRLASAKATATRKANRKAAKARDVAAWHRDVAAEIVGIPDLSLCNVGVEGSDDPGFPEPSVPPGTPFRWQRIEAAQKAIDEACRRARAKGAR